MVYKDYLGLGAGGWKDGQQVKSLVYKHVDLSFDRLCT